MTHTREFWAKQYENQFAYLNSIFEGFKSDQRYQMLLCTALVQLFYFKEKMETEKIFPYSPTTVDELEEQARQRFLKEYRDRFKTNPNFIWRNDEWDQKAWRGEIGIFLWKDPADPTKGVEFKEHQPRQPWPEDTKWQSSHDNIGGHAVVSFQNGKAEVSKDVADQLKQSPFCKQEVKDWSNATLEDVPEDWIPENGQQYWIVGQISKLPICFRNNDKDLTQDHKKTYGRIFPTERLAQMYLEQQNNKSKNNG